MTKSRKRNSTGDAVSARHASDILRELDGETVSFNGEEISMLEAGIRLLYARSLNGDVQASIELEKIRDRCGADKPPKKYGCLVVPEPMSLDDFAKFAFEQQAQFRERDYGSDLP